ncbi:transposase [Sphingobacterium sp. WQ 366]|uniref:Transposase n=2 Tax=Sphingobacterium bovistauri TaxID=2781959 RepID=A0ABS7ZD84_9SPHI|nr:transposase [Sphingobacterium bovistauri]
MDRKVKHTLSFKKTCIDLYTKSSESILGISKEYKVSESLLRRWIQDYEKYGLKGLYPKKNQIYSSEFKHRVLLTMEREKLSLSEARLRYRIPSDSIIVQWRNIFSKFGLEGLKSKPRGRQKKMSTYKRKAYKSQKPLTREEELLLENERLRCENAFLKKFNALIQAEEEKLNSRKSKPSKN